MGENGGEELKFRGAGLSVRYVLASALYMAGVFTVIYACWLLLRPGESGFLQGVVLPLVPVLVIFVVLDVITSHVIRRGTIYTLTPERLGMTLKKDIFVPYADITELTAVNSPFTPPGYLLVKAGNTTYRLHPERYHAFVITLAARTGLEVRRPSYPAFIIRRGWPIALFLVFAGLCAVGIPDRSVPMVVAKGIAIALMAAACLGGSRRPVSA